MTSSPSSPEPDGGLDSVRQLVGELVDELVKLNQVVGEFAHSSRRDRIAARGLVLLFVLVAAFGGVSFFRLHAVAGATAHSLRATQEQQIANCQTRNVQSQQEAISFGYAVQLITALEMVEEANTRATPSVEQGRLTAYRAFLLHVQGLAVVPPPVNCAALPKP